MSPRRLKPSERKAWAKVARSVRPLSGVEPPETMEDLLGAPSQPQYVRRTSSRLKAGQPSATTKNRSKTVVPKTPQNREGERKVRRGQVSIDASLDLHGHTQDSAYFALARFIPRQRRLGARCVLIITGKGKRGEGVLRQRFLQWINSPDANGTVSGFASAHQRHGGGGAWYVFLRRLSD